MADRPVPSLEDGFALMRTLYEAGYGVEFIAAPEPAPGLMAITIPVKGIHRGGGRIRMYTIWGRLTELVASHGVVPYVSKNAIGFALSSETESGPSDDRLCPHGNPFCGQPGWSKCGPCHDDMTTATRP